MKNPTNHKIFVAYAPDTPAITIRNFLAKLNSEITYQYISCLWYIHFHTEIDEKTIYQLRLLFEDFMEINTNHPHSQYENNTNTSNLLLD